MARFFRWQLLALLLLYCPQGLRAQATIEVPLVREQAKNQLLPPFLHALKPQIEEQLQAKLVEMDQGFTRNQIVEIPLSDLLKERKTEFLKMIRDQAQLKDEWAGLLEKLNFMTVRVSFKLKVLPHTESLALQFQPATDKRSLVQFEGNLRAKPEVQVTEISGFEILEINPDTGRATSYSLPASMRELEGPQSLAFDRSIDFKMIATMTENFATKDPNKIFEVNLEKWESTFKDVLLSEESALSLINQFLREDRFFALSSTLARTKTYQEFLGRDQKPNTSIVEREIKAQLDSRREKMIVWVERDPAGKLIPHLSSNNERNRNRIEVARSQNRLLLEAHSEIPLTIESIDVDVDYAKKIARARFQPHPEFESTFNLKTFRLPSDWMGEIDDPLMKSIISQLYGRNLFEGKDVSVQVKLQTREKKEGEWLEGLGGELEVPLEFKDGDPHIRSSDTKVTLPFLDQVRFEEINLKWGTENAIQLKPQSEIPLEKQLTSQLESIVAAHESILGEDFFKNIEGSLLSQVEKQIEGIEGDEKGRKADDPAYHFKVLGFPISKEGDVRCKVIPKRDSRPNLGYRFLPSGLGFDVVSAPSLLELECEVTLPSKIDLSLTNIKSSQGNVSKIDFSLASKDGNPQTAKVRMRVVRDPEAGFLMVVPETWNVDEVMKNYQIPTTGAGAPQIYGIDAHGVKGFVSDVAKAPALIWTYLINPRVNLGPTAEAVVTVGTLAPYVYANKLEHEEVDKILRDSVQKYTREMSYKLPETAFKELNGDVVKRRKLAKQPKLPESQWNLLRHSPTLLQGSEWVDPAKVEIGIIGKAEERILEKLKVFREQTPYAKPLGPFVVDDQGQTARNVIEAEVRDEAVKTMEGTGGVKEISDIISNPWLKDIAHRIRKEGVSFISTAVSRSATALERAVIDFLRTRPEKPPLRDEDKVETAEAMKSTPETEEELLSPLESVERILSSKVIENATQRSRIAVPDLNLPDFCGVSFTPFRDEDVGDVLSLIANIEGYEKLPTLGAIRPTDSPRLKDLMKAYDYEGVIPVSVSTDVLERIANDPQNLSRVTNLIREEAVKQPGIRKEDFKLEIRQPKVRMREDGQAVVRVGVKIDQPATTFQTITGVIGFIPDAILSLLTGEDQRPFRTIAGLPGWLADQITSPITDIDGFMELEIPVNVSVGDRLDMKGRHIGHYIEAWSDPNQVKIRNKEGWSSVFGSMARDKIEENANSFSRSLNFDQPLAVPGFEDLMTFKMGNSMNFELSRKTVVGVPTARELYQGEDGLYTGSFVFKLRPQINPAYQSWPSIIVKTPQNPVAESNKTD